MERVWQNDGQILCMIYVCTYVRTYFVIILVAPYEVSVMGNPLHSKGSQLTLNCASEGGPQLRYIWVFLGNIISNSSMLIIDNVTTTDGGNYTCAVTNDAGSSDAIVTVYSKSFVITINCVHVCVCVLCVYVCVYICMCVCVCGCICVYVYVYIKQVL